MSAPRSRYLKASKEITQFLNWVVISAIDLDYAVTTMAKAKRRSGHGDEDSLKRELAVGAGATRKLSLFYRLMTEMTLCRAVDNYLVYLTDLLSLIFRSRPESLRSGEEVSLDFVLAHATRSNLIKALVDRKVNQLSFYGMRALSQYLSKKLGFALFPKEADLDRAILLVEMRNLIVHGRGIVNETFVQRVVRSSFPRGTRLKFSINDVTTHIGFLNLSVADIERRAHEKFGVRLPYKIPSQFIPQIQAKDRLPRALPGTRPSRLIDS
jgi:hypothetical protein